jgi:hypothetical protein
VALETADAAILHGRVADVSRMIDLSRGTMANASRSECSGWPACSGGRYQRPLVVGDVGWIGRANHPPQTESPRNLSP